MDYVYQLKAVAGAATTLRLTKLDLTYAETQAGFDNTSFRAAVFVQDITDSGAAASTGNTAITATTTIQDTTLSKLFAPSGATNFHKGDSDNPQAVSAADATKNVTYNNNTEAISVGEGTHYYKVVVRVWLEGEDTHCNNTTFAKLDEGEWGLDVEWQLGGSTALANQLKVTQTATRTALTGIASSVSGTPVKINDVDYYKINTVKNVDYYVATNAAVTTTSRVYTITEGRVTDVTHLVTITLAT